MIRRGINIVARLVLAVGATLALSCVRDDAGVISVTKDIISQDVNLGFGSSTLLTENVPLRAIVIGAEGTPYAGEFCNNESLMSDNIFFATLSGVRDIYFMAYEPDDSGLDGDLDNKGKISYGEMCDARIMFDADAYDNSVAGFNEARFPAVAKSIKATLEPEVLNELDDLSMERRTAKVEVNLTYTKVSERYSEYDFEIVSLQVVDLPKWSYWIDEVRYPVEEGFAETNLQSVTNLVTGPQLDTDEVADHISNNTFYVPSYYVTDNNTAKIAIGLRRVRKDGDPLAADVQEYLTKYFPLGDALNITQTGSPEMNISPNRNYKVNLSVYAESFVIYTEILPWEMVDLSGDIVEPNTISAPSLIIMDVNMLYGYSTCKALFSANLPIEAYVNGELVVEGTKLTDYVDSKIDMSWLTDSTLSYDSGVDNSGHIALDYDPTNENINESNYKLEVVFKSGYLSRTMTVISGLYAGAIYGDLDDWELEDLDELITQQRSLYLPAYTAVIPSTMELDEHTITVPYRSTHDVTLHIGDGKTIVEGDGVELTEEEGNGWVTRVDIFNQVAESNGTKYITFTIDKTVQLDDLDKIRTYYSLSILDGLMSVESYLLYSSQSYGVDGDVEGDWESEPDVDGEIYDQYDLQAPFKNYINVLTLKQDLVDYYDITYTSTHEVTALFDGVEVGSEYVEFDNKINGWVVGAQFLTPYASSGVMTKVLRVWVDTTFGEGDNYTDDVNDLTIDVTLLSHRITKYIEIRIGGTSDDLDGYLDGDWDSVPDVDGDIFDQYLLNAPYTNLVSVISLKQDLVDYYDIPYTSTHETTALIAGVEVATDRVDFESAINGWLVAAQFVKPYSTSDATFLRIWVDLSYGEGDDFTSNESELTVEITLLSHRITKYITAKLSDLSEDVDVDLDGDWDSVPDVDGDIFDQYLLDAPQSNLISILTLKQDLVDYHDIPYTSTHETTAEIEGVEVTTDRVVFAQPIKGWLVAAQFVQPYEGSDATFLRLWVNLDYDGDDLNIDITLFSHKITKHISATLADLTEDLNSNVGGDGWDDESDVDGEIFDQYLLNVPAVNAISVNALKQSGVDYYDIIYESTLTTTAVIEGVDITGNDVITFVSPLRGWLKSMQFIDDLYDDSTKKVLRIWINTDYGSGNGYTADPDNLSIDFVMLSHNITKHVNVTLHDLTEDLDGFTDDDWELEGDIDGEILDQDDISIAGSIELSRWVYSWVVVKPGEPVVDGEDGEYSAPEYVEMDNSVDGYFMASIPYSSTADLSITLPNVSGSWIESITLTDEPWDSANPDKVLVAPTDNKSGWLTIKFSKATDTNLNSSSFDVVFKNRYMQTTTRVSYNAE